MNVCEVFEFRVRSYECGQDGHATFPAVCDYLQEAAGEHALQLGFSKSNFESKGVNISWVLTRLRVRMSRLPAWREKVLVETYPRSGHRVTACRDFILRVDDEMIGVATSEWMVIDLATRKIVPVPAFVRSLVDDVRTPVLGGEPFSKLRWSCCEDAGETRFLARRGDIDLNGHVNNARYVAWVLETLPDGAGSIQELEIVFKSETLKGDEVRAGSVEVEPGVWAAHLAAADGREHVVARIVVA